MDYKVTKKYWIENYFCTRADIFNCCLCLDILKCVEYNLFRLSKLEIYEKKNRVTEKNKNLIRVLKTQISI